MASLVPRESADYDDIGGQLVAGPLGLVYDVSLVSPVGAVFCRGCSGQRNKAVSCSEAPSNTSNSSVLSDSSNFSCSSPD